MAANAAVLTTPDPAACPVVVIPLPQIPVGANPPPATLKIAVQHTAAVLVMADAAETTPPPPYATMMPVVVVVPPDQVPVAANIHPPRSSPALEDPLAVQMAANAAALTTPEPAIRPVVVVPLPDMPVGTNKPPVTITIAPVQLALAVPVETNAFVATPPPLCPTGETVGVVVAPPQMPVFANKPPVTITIAPVQLALAVQMAANAFVATPPPLCPAGEMVRVVVPPDQVPPPTNVAIVIAPPIVEPAPAVQMAANAFVATPIVMSASVAAGAAATTATAAPPCRLGFRLNLVHVGRVSRPPVLRFFLVLCGAHPRVLVRGIL